MLVPAGVLRRGHQLVLGAAEAANHVYLRHGPCPLCCALIGWLPLEGGANVQVLLRYRAVAWRGWAGVIGYAIHRQGPLAPGSDQSLKATLAQCFEKQQDRMSSLQQDGPFTCQVLSYLRVFG